MASRLPFKFVPVGIFMFFLPAGLFAQTQQAAPGLSASWPSGTPAVLPCDTPPPGMACVPGGPFLRGSDDGPKDSMPASTVWVQTFFIDINEVTVKDFNACIKSGRCRKAGPLYQGFSEPDMPINGISWFDADNYCRLATYGGVFIKCRRKCHGIWI